MNHSYGWRSRIESFNQLALTNGNGSSTLGSVSVENAFVAEIVGSGKWEYGSGSEGVDKKVEGSR
jgi:hypothetical protein